MKRGINYPASGNPVFAWTELAFDVGEMMMASAFVIDRRTRRMNAAGGRLSARDRRELNRMQEEKIQAAVQSTEAVARRMLALDPLLGMRAYRQMLEVGMAMLSLAGSHTVNQFAWRQAALLRAVAESADVWSRSSASLARAGLGPIQATVAANARRLRKY